MYKAKDQFFPPVIEGNVRLTGSSLTLGVGEVAFVDVNKTTKDGVKILSEFSPIDPSAKLAIRMGEPKDNVSRSEDNKDISTIPFTLKDVVDIYVDAPERPGILVDDFVIGFNGEDGSEIDLDNGENEQIEVCLGGNLMGMLGLPDSKHVARINLTAPIEGVKGVDWTMHEIVENAFLELKNYRLPANIPITEYVDVMLVNSDNGALAGTPTTFYTLSVPCSDRTFSELGRIQAQYPDLDIKRLEWESGVATYSAIAGALPAAYQAQSSSKLKGCDACPAGYTELDQGLVYEVVIEDPTDLTAAVQALPGAEAGTAVLNETVGDTNTYSLVVDDELTQTEIDAFIAANAGTSRVYLVAEDVVALCQPALPATVAWIQGESCFTTTEDYSIILKDTECGESRLAELELAYPDLTITEAATPLDDCQRQYNTTVNTSLVCDECGDIFRDVFESEAPAQFEAVSWTKAPKVYSSTAKMGIRVRGKEAKLGASNLLLDDMPFFWGSVEISLAGGFPTYTNESYLSGTNERFAVKYFSRKADAQNLGGNMRKFEDEAQMHFRGRTRYYKNNYGRLVSGQETRLEAFEQYAVYSVTIAPHRHVSNFQQPQNGATTYHFVVELGKQGDFEDTLNKLAAAAGIPQIQAVSK